MAQALAGVGGVPRNISEIYVGIGGAKRAVTEVYVGVNGAPRLAWSGNKWANKLYYTGRSTSYGNNEFYFWLYQVDTETLTHWIINQVLGGWSPVQYYDGSNTGCGSGVGVFRLHTGTGGCKVFDTDIDTLAVVKYYLNTTITDDADLNSADYAWYQYRKEYFKGYLYGLYSSWQHVGCWDSATGAFVGSKFIGACNSNYTNADSRNLYLGWQPMHRVESYSEGTHTKLYSLSGAAGKMTMNDRYIYTTVSSLAENVPVYAYDKATGAQVRQGITPTRPAVGVAFQSFAVNLFSPKKK